AVAIAVFGDQQQAAVEMTAGGGGGAGAAAGAGQQVLDAGVEAAGPLGAFAHRGEDAQAGSAGERFGGVVGLGERGPVFEQVVAVGLQRVAVALVEVHAGELAAAQHRQGGGGVAFAHGGGEGGEGEGGALAIAAGEVDVAGGERGAGDVRWLGEFAAEGHSHGSCFHRRRSGVG